MRRRTMSGYFDCARHEHSQLTWYHATDVVPPATFGHATFGRCYVNPRRRLSGAPPSDRARNAVLHALDAIRSSAAATERLLMARAGQGLEGRPHATGGGWAATGGITFYVARCFGSSEDGHGHDDGGSSAWREFLCADVDDCCDLDHDDVL